MGCCVASIFVMIRIIYKQRADGSIKTDEFKERFSSLIEGLRTSNFVSCYWNVLIMIRWQITVIILLFLKDWN